MSAPGQPILPEDADLLARADAFLANQDIQDVTKKTLGKEVVDEKGITSEEGAPFVDRLKMSFMTKPESKEAFLVKKFGQDRVFKTDKGKLGYEDDNGVKRLVDPTSDIFSASDLPGDIADAAGPLTRVIPGLMMGVAGARLGLDPVKIAALSSVADVGGAIAAQTAGKAVGEDLTSKERLADIGVTAAAGLAPSVVGLATRGALQVPIGLGERAAGNRISRVLLGGEKASKMMPAIEDGLALEQKIGGPPLSASELANTQSAHGFYGMLRRDPLASQVVTEADIAKGEALTAFKDKTLRAVARGGDVDPSTAGSSAARAWKADRVQKNKALSVVSDKLYGAREEASGGKPVIPLSATSGLPSILAQKFEGNPGLKAIISEVTSNVEEMTAKGPSVRAQVFNNSLSYWRQRAEDQSLRPNERLVAHMTEDAMRADLDAATQIAGNSGQVAQGLVAVRSLYREAKQAMAKDESDLLEKMMKVEDLGRGDTLTGMLAKRSPLEIKQTMAVLQRTVPDDANALRASAIEELVSKSTANGKMNPASFAKTLSDKKTFDRVLALFEGEPDAADFLSELRQSMKYAERIGRQGTTSGGSPTAPLQWMNKLTNGIPVVQGMVPAIKEHLLRIPPERQIALLMNNKEGRKLFLGMVKPTGTMAGASARSLAQMAGIIVSEDQIYGDR